MVSKAVDRSNNVRATAFLESTESDMSFCIFRNAVSVEWELLYAWLTFKIPSCEMNFEYVFVFWLLKCQLQR